MLNDILTCIFANMVTYILTIDYRFVTCSDATRTPLGCSCRCHCRPPRWRSRGTLARWRWRASSPWDSPTAGWPWSVWPSTWWASAATRWPWRSPVRTDRLTDRQDRMSALLFVNPLAGLVPVPVGVSCSCRCPKPSFPRIGASQMYLL